MHTLEPQDMPRGSIHVHQLAVSIDHQHTVAHRIDHQPPPDTQYSEQARAFEAIGQTTCREEKAEGRGIEVGKEILRHHVRRDAAPGRDAATHHPHGGASDPLYLARRLVRSASEDSGNADPRALRLALDAWEAQERLGSPEGELALAQAAVYLAVAPKSNAVYRAFAAARTDAASHGSLEVPPHLRNAPTRLARQLGHGDGYRYAHDEPEGYAAGERYLPDAIAGTRYYSPPARGLEVRIGEKLERLRALDRAHEDLDQSTHRAPAASTDPRNRNA